MCKYLKLLITCSKNFFHLFRKISQMTSCNYISNFSLIFHFDHGHIQRISSPWGTHFHTLTLVTTEPLWFLWSLTVPPWSKIYQDWKGRKDTHKKWTWKMVKKNLAPKRMETDGFKPWASQSKVRLFCVVL